jgi:hypothetical protein
MRPSGDNADAGDQANGMSNGEDKGQGKARREAAIGKALFGLHRGCSRARQSIFTGKCWAERESVPAFICIWKRTQRALVARHEVVMLVSCHGILDISLSSGASPYPGSYIKTSIANYNEILDG